MARPTNREPTKPLFLRIPESVHAKIVAAAAKRGISANSYFINLGMKAFEDENKAA